MCFIVTKKTVVFFSHCFSRKSFEFYTIKLNGISHIISTFKAQNRLYLINTKTTRKKDRLFQSFMVFVKTSCDIYCVDIQMDKQVYGIIYNLLGWILVMNQWSCSKEIIKLLNSYSESIMSFCVMKHVLISWRNIQSRSWWGMFSVGYGRTGTRWRSRHPSGHILSKQLIMPA